MRNTVGKIELEKVVVFTGAGFCKPLGLPTTIEFQNHINKVIPKNKLGNALKNYLGENYYDIEHLLSTLEIFANSNSFLKHLIFNETIIGSPHFAQLQSELRSFRDLSKDYLVNLKASLWEILNKYDRALAIKQYSYLLGEIKHNFPTSAISFFSTNYDLTFEDIQDELDELYDKHEIEGIDFGFTAKGQRNYWDITKKYVWSQETIEYKKLHGSLDWNTTANKIIQTGVSMTPPDPSKMLLLYPGFKGAPNSEPYRTLHEQLFERLFSANIVLVIGFAFRDDYINNIFETALKMNKEVEIYCYNPVEYDKLPNTSNIFYLCEKYPQFKYVNHAISPSPWPLDLKKNIPPF